ncbi:MULTISPECIES: ABC transporter permease [unclassified Halorubrum]|uniref:ABC transporter permease n=1 Tax=unclassified Halorubrum TaxID=2642239 RepID=UPI000B995761|nr:MULTISPECIES: ABC transporter permease [unclassified Halorubrum]OYR44133.1 ABC transporter [Halorubrum sp. Eb13]OYR46717.1 ABC transporter [Halorubrum sp. Hd13]OYR47329.1 ABC transporter [Halorubrum sp. Ea8]OYR55582.1 ABC transporter [Halorubrum sp. Ea1]
MSNITDEGDVSGSDTAQKAPGNSSVADMQISVKRWLVKTSRNPFVTFSSLIQPVIFFVLMAEVLGAIVSGALAQTVGSDINYITYLTPAIVIQSALAAAAVSGIGLVDDMDTGMFEKLLASPMDRGAMFLGKVLSEVVRIVVQTTIILLLGYVMLYLQSGASVGSYLRTGLLGFIGVIAIAVIFGGAFMAFSNIVALVTHDQEATTMIANLLTFPLLFISSAFVPLEVLPGWIQSVAVVNPITYGVDGVRAFMLGQNVMTVFYVTAFSGLWNTVIPSVAVLIGFNVVLGGFAVHLLNRASKAKVQ